MKKILIAVLTVIFIYSSMLISFAQEDATDPGWPRKFEAKGNEVVVFQPQLNEWVDYKVLRGKAAAVVQLKGYDQEYYGALDLEADTETDHESRTVLLKNFKVTDSIFPNIEKTLAGKCSKVVQAALPKDKTLLIALDRILAGLEGTKGKAKGVEVNLDPPPIYTSENPAILVLFMGEPKFEEVENVSGLLYAVNTNWDILLEVGSSKYYLLNGENWLVTEDMMKGPWKASWSLPESFSRLPDDENWKAVKQNIPGVKATEVPKVFVSTEPAELIVTEGKPSYSPIAGTKLMHVTNTESDLFLHNGDGMHYLLTAGRWFKAKKIKGPWNAASADLPEDFSKIPADHDKAYILNSVPGTPEAEAAVLLASVPRKATVNRKDAQLTVAYEGDPVFVVIDGTSTVYYAVNTPNSVFRVEKKYYSVHDGVWFESKNSTGPWTVCTNVPDVIYTIPASHPKHNVTYVYVYDSTPDTVVVGYTSGYSGSYVAATGVVMFGLGWWIGSEIWDDHYHHYHHYHYHPHYYSYGCAARYDYYYGGYYRSARHYGPYGGAGGWAGYNPATGRYYRGGYAHGPYGSAFARQAYNPYTDRYAAQVRTKTPYGSWGRTVVADGDKWVRAGHRTERGRTLAGMETSEGAKAVGRYNKWTDQGAVIGKNKYGDVYAGRDGNVFKRTDDGWQKNSGKGWENVNTGRMRESSRDLRESARENVQSRDLTTQQRVKLNRDRTTSRTAPSRDQFSNLNRDFDARQRGNQRTRTFQQSRTTGFRGGSFGGSRSIGRGRR